MEQDQQVIHGDDGFGSRLHGGCEARLDLASIPRRQGLELEAQHWRCRLHFHQLQTMAGVVPIPDDGHAGDAGHNFLDQFQPLRALLCRDKREAGDVATRPRQTVDEARSDGIADLAITMGMVPVALRAACETRSPVSR